MGVIGNIDEIPLFSTPQEALAWAIANGTTGYHTHNFNGRIGYMGGTTHAGINTGQQVNRSNQTTTQRSSGSSGGGSSSGGGGGGY